LVGGPPPSRAHRGGGFILAAQSDLPKKSESPFERHYTSQRPYRRIYQDTSASEEAKALLGRL
jgi:hypothetical protein